LPYAMPHKPLAASSDYYTPETPDDLYADVVRELDGSIGRILDALEELALDDNTLVIFTSDNGPWFGGSTGGLRGMKGRSWEGGIRVPFVARYPGRIVPGVLNDAPAAMIDVLPTIAAYAGLDLPNDRVIDGRDIRGLFEDSQAQSPHEAIYSMRGSELATIRMGRWKLHVRDPGSVPMSELTREEKENWVDPRGPDGVHIIAPFEQANPAQHPGVTSGDTPEAMMLFDLEKDPAEQHNVTDAHSDIVARLKQNFDETARLVPDIEEAPRSYLLEEPSPGERRPLMNLVGGDLRYDNVAEDQRHLLREDRD
jgi:arylsulfatase A-like enzyme